jgi:hypothetical protein
MALDMGGAAGGAEMLQEVLKRKMMEAYQNAQIRNEQASLAERSREANMTNDVQQGNLVLGNKRVAEDARQFNEQAPLRIANVGHLNASTTELQRKPQAEQTERDFTLSRDKSNQAFTSGENAKSRANAMAIAKDRAANSGGGLTAVQTVDENGNPVTQFVRKQEGASYVKPANATTATRVSSAETVNAVGSDIIKKLSDPKYAAVVGPALGRAGTLRDFIGNAPPEFNELAGQIESYALANMGVHGMRSAQGAEAIKKLLDQHHSPESLAATIRGLNDFSTRFVAGNKPRAGSGAATDTPSGGGSAPKRVRYDMNGNQIQD